MDFTGGDREGVYELVRCTLVKLGYHRLGKSDKGLVKRYPGKVTGFSRAQLTRLIGQHRATGGIVDRRGQGPSAPFARRYTQWDIRLLAEVDAELGQMSGAATRAVLRREWRVFGDARFKRLAKLSNGHLYNLRKSPTYRNLRTVWTLTCPTAVRIGVRRRPDPRGRPGYVRVGQFTKSRARHTNDNALVESKNGSVIRKWLGYDHIPAHLAEPVHAFNRQWLLPFLNHHRPCQFPTEVIDPKDRVRKRYRDADVMTPYEKLKSLPHAAQYLKPGVTFGPLDAAAHAMSDLEAVKALNRAREELFAFIDAHKNAAA